MASTGRGARADLTAVAAGVVLGYVLHLSHGLVLGGVFPLVVPALTRRWRAAALAVLGALAVVGVFTAAGFWWFTGLEHLRVIYAASAAKDRPYAYFVWANLAALAFVVGPAAVAGLRRLAATPAGPAGSRRVARRRRAGRVLAADLSGLSNAEVERIWLPFAIWLIVAAALFPARQGRWWLAGQAGLALAVNHLLFTVW